jgi:MscS family membrane protein
MQKQAELQAGGDVMASVNYAGKHASFMMLVLFLVIFTSQLTGLGPSPANSASRSISDITVDRSTPELHLETFLTAVQRGIIRMEAREWARGYYDAWLYPAITKEQSAEIGLLRRYILDSMDLSGFPEWRRESAGMETALMLWDILKAEKVTPETRFRQIRDGLWVIPDTYIQVGAISSGMRMGDVVFTAETVASVPQLYQTVVGERAAGFNAYRYYTETPGGMEPPRWGGLAHKLPEFLRWGFGSNTMFQWIITLLILAVVVLVPRFIGRRFHSPSIRWFCQGGLMALFAAYAPGIVVEQAGLSGAAATVMTLVFLALHSGGIVICVLIIGEWIGNWLSAVQQAKDKTFDTSIIRLATRVASFVTALAIIIHGLSAAGVPVYGIIAGFGVGGLAFALAAKPTLENILAGVILFLDGSIKVGDVIEAGDLSGTVEDIGMRSTRIRSRDGGLISVTNSELADKVVKNVSQRVLMPQPPGTK